MKTFRLFATLFVVALCSTVVSSCSDDDDDKDEITIVGKWKSTENNVLEFKSNGNFTYEYSVDDDAEGGKWKIESSKLYMMWSDDDEPEWTAYKINELSSVKLIIQEYDADGTLSDWTESYQRMN